MWQHTTAASAPAIGNIGPDMGKAGNVVTIDGRGFGAAKGTVLFDATAVTGANIVSWEDTQIKVVVPAIAAKKNIRSRYARLLVPVAIAMPTLTCCLAIR